MPFVAQTQADLDAVLSRLLAVETELAEVETTAPAAALRIHTGSPQDGDKELIDRLPDLRRQRDELRMAHEAADAAERQRVENQRHKEIASRVRAGLQHISRLDKDMHAAAQAADAMVRSFTRAADAARALYALFPNSKNLDALTPSRLARLIQAEIERAGRATGVRVFDGKDIPWTKSFETRGSGVIAPFDHLLGLGVGPVRARLRDLLHEHTLPAAVGEEVAADSDPPAPSAAAPIPDEPDIDEAA